MSARRDRPGDADPAPEPSATPVAEVVPLGRVRGGLGSLALPLLAILLAVVLALREWGERGLELIVVARTGHDIESGDALRYRGIKVGELREVRLSDDLEVVASLRAQLDLIPRGDQCSTESEAASPPR